RTWRRRDAADRADQGERRLVQRLCEQERAEALGAPRRDGGADAVSRVRRGELRDRDDPVRRWRLDRDRRPLHAAGDVTEGGRRSAFGVRGSGFGVRGSWFWGSRSVRL